MPPSLSPTPGVPRQQVGRYTICEPIAAGGMATVSSDICRAGRLLARCGREATRIAHLAIRPSSSRCSSTKRASRARIRHPNVVPTLDVWSDEGRHLLGHGVRARRVALRLASSARRSDNSPFRCRISTAILVSVLHGLHAAHEAKTRAASRSISCIATFRRKTSSSVPMAPCAYSTSASPKPFNRGRTRSREH